MQKSSDSLKIFSFNVEGFVSKKAQGLITTIMRSENVLLVVDESSRIKRPGAKRTKFITQIGKEAKYRRILTGTPVTKGPEDVYSQFKFLDPYILGYESFYSFRVFHLEGSFFYSDSHNDLPLLRQVDHPIAVDPDPLLRQEAKDQKWPIVTLR